jgi:hypothetical protein
MGRQRRKSGSSKSGDFKQLLGMVKKEHEYYQAIYIKGERKGNEKGKNSVIFNQ